MGKPMVALRVLGGFDVVVDTVAVGDAWPGRRSAELVQLLAISPGRRLTRDEVIEALWPHLPADAGAANLRKAAHHARRALGIDDAVVLRHGEVRLFPDADVTSDLDEFLAAADAAIATGATARAEAAAAAYGGTLVPGARYEDWAEPRRRAVAERYAAVLRIAGSWEAVLEQDPTDEDACRAAMRAALTDGQRHRAVALFGRLRDALEQELGVAPGTETWQLYEQSRSGLVVTRPTVVGRHRELAIVDELLQVGTGSQLVTISGVAGIGKTALTHEFSARASAAGWATVAITADGPDDAYATLAQLARELIALDRDTADALDPNTRAVIAMIVPLPGDATPPGLPLTRHRVLGAIQTLVTAAAAGHAILLVVDDAERADPSSLEVLALLGDRDIGRTVLCLAHRAPSASTALDRALARAARIRPPVAVPLDRLAPADARAMARGLRPVADDAAVNAVVARADGVPLFVAALIATDGADVGDAIAALLVDLPEHEIAWLRRLAIADGPLDLDGVLSMTGCDADEADELLDDAIGAGVLAVDDHRYRFRHELVRASLAAQLPPHRRAAVHRDAARRLTELGAGPGRIAGQWAAGRRPAEAADWSVIAAEDAIRLGGYSAAVEHLDVALALVPGHPAALRRRADALDAMGDPRALAAYDAAIAAAPGDTDELRPLQALAQIKLGDPEGALRTLDGVEPSSLPSQLARALTFSGAALMGITAPDEGTRLATIGRDLALRSGNPAAVVVASWAQAAVAHARGELRESLRVDLADTSSLPDLAVTVFDAQLCITQRLLYGNRPYADVIRFTERFAAEAERLGAARGVAFATTLRGEAELLSGRLDDAELDLRRGAELHRRLAAPTGHAFSMQRLAELAAARGDRDEARRAIDEALDIARSSGIGFHLLDRIYGTKIALAVDPQAALDAVIEAEAAVRGPFETCPGCRITLAVPAAIAAARMGDLDRLDTYEQSCTWLAEVVMQLPAWDAALDEVRAHKALAHGEPTRAAALFRSAADRFRMVEHILDADRCATHAAELAS